MSFIPPTTIAVMLSANVVRLFTRRLPAHEQVLHGLTYNAAIPSSDLPALLEPSPEGYIIPESSRKTSVRELLSQGRFKRRFEYSTVQGSLPAGLRQPWEEIEEHFGGRELGIVTQVLAFSVIAHISVSTIECFQGNPPGISTIPVFFALVAAICISLVRRLVAATVVSKSKSSTNERPTSGTNPAGQRSETYYAFIFAFAFSIVTASFLSYFLFIAEGTEFLGGYLPSLGMIGGSGSGDINSPNVRLAKQSSQELPWLDLGASLRLGIGHFSSRMETVWSLLFNWNAHIEARATLEESSSSHDSLPSTFALIVFIAVISPVLGGISALLFSPSRRVGRLAHEMSTESAFKAAGQGQETITGVSTYLLYRLWTFLQFYGPLVVSLLWIRPMVGYVFVSPLLVRCSEEAVSRECFPPDFIQTTPSSPAQDSFISSGALFTAPSLTDSQWLQVRLTALLAVCAFQVYNIRSLVQLSLRKSESDQVDHVVGAAIASPVEKVTLDALALAASGQTKKANTESKTSSTSLPKSGPQPSGYTSSQLAEITETLFMDQLKAVLSAASVAVLTLSVPALLIGLALLALRTGGFVGGMGVCSASKSLLSYLMDALYSALQLGSKAPSFIPEPGSFPPRRSALELLLDAANGAQSSGTVSLVELGTSASETGRHLALVISTLADALGPSFWRPVMSFSVWWLLVVSALMQEFGFLLARYLIV